MTAVTTAEPEPPDDDPSARLSRRVGYAEAAEMLCVSVHQLQQLVRTGELPVIQPARGKRPALIEVRALDDLMDRWRVEAQRRATSRRRRRKGGGK